MFEGEKPLSDCQVVDLGTGLAGALSCRFLLEMGALVHRAEGNAGDPFYDLYAAYKYWQSGKHIDLYSDIDSALRALDYKLRHASICLVGGEDFAGYDWSVDTDALARTYPHLVILEISGGGAGGYDSSLPANDLLVQARTGLVFEQSEDRPAVWAFPAGGYGAALQGLTGLFAALCERETSGRGQIVRTSLFEGVLAWLSHDWFRFETQNKVSSDVTPKAARPLIFKCADNRFIHIILASTDSRKILFTLLGVENPEPSLEDDPRGMPSNTRPARYYYENVDMLAPYVAEWSSDTLLIKLWQLGVSAEVVKKPGEIWDEEQVRLNHLLTVADDGATVVGLPVDYRAVPCQKTEAKTAVSHPTSAPLSDVRVIDFGTFTAGPHSSIVLSDLGANVLKVEPIGGDPMRFYFLKFTGSSRGKRVIELNLKTPEGQEIARALCAKADLVHHNFRPGVTQRLGIDEAKLRKENPDLVICETSAYGLTGPKASYGGFDMIFHSYCGHAVRNSGEDGMPRNYRLPIVDFTAGLVANLSLTAGYFSKLRKGTGAAISTSLLDCGLFLLSELVRRPDGTFEALPELDAQSAGHHPAERLYQVGSAWIAIAAVNSDMAKALALLLDIDELRDLPRESWRPEHADMIAQAVVTKEPSQFLDSLHRAGIWAEPCRRNAMEHVFDDPEFRENGTIVSDNDPDYGQYLQLGALVRFSRSATEPSGRSPRRGSDTRSILKGLGYSEDAIDDLYGRGIVG